jgi:hypothetical protein
LHIKRLRSSSPQEETLYVEESVLSKFLHFGAAFALPSSIYESASWLLPEAPEEGMMASTATHMTEEEARELCRRLVWLFYEFVTRPDASQRYFNAGVNFAITGSKKFTRGRFQVSLI